MIANVHCLLHLPKCVETLGPLWATSCFPFENANAQLLKLFHGSKGVEKQVGLHIKLHIFYISGSPPDHYMPILAQESLQPESYIHYFYEQMATEVHKRYLRYIS